MNTENAETIRKAVDYYCRTFGTGAEEFDLATSIAESEVVDAAALAYASLLDGTHPDLMLVHRNAPSITSVVTHLRAEWFRHGLHDVESTPARELRQLVRSFGRALALEAKRVEGDGE